MTSLHDIAPRLARARDAWVTFERWRDRERLRLADQRLDLERLVAHRDLQLIRAGHASRRRRRYLEERQAKLAAAQHALTCVIEAQRELEARQ